jgi:hypothetical protein
MFTSRTHSQASDPNPRRRSKMTILVVAAATAAAGLGLAAGPLLSASPAQAIPFAQQACAHDNLTITPPPGGGASPYVPLGPPLSVTLSKAAYVVAFLSIDGNVSSSTSAEMRASWSVDGATPTDFEYGPGNIHEGDGPFEGANTLMDVIHLGAGSHSVQPEVRMNGAAGTSGVVGTSCAVIEAHTS